MCRLSLARIESPFVDGTVHMMKANVVRTAFKAPWSPVVFAFSARAPWANRDGTADPANVLVPVEMMVLPPDNSAGTR